MPRRTHPFFSGIGCAATLLVIAVLAAVVYARGETPFSAGPLAAAPQNAPPRAPGTLETVFESHAQFEQDCNRCHIPWRGVSAARCETCHVGVAAERQAGEGLHGLIAVRGDCTQCHTEHLGRTASLTHVSSEVIAQSPDFARFHIFPLDHGEAGVQACGVCHEQSFSAYTCHNCHEHEPAEVREEHLEEGIREFEDCVACHLDVLWPSAINEGRAAGYNMVNVAHGGPPRYRYEKGSPFNAALLFGLHLTVVGRVGDSARQGEAREESEISSMSRGSSNVWTAPFGSGYRSAWDRNGENALRVAFCGGRITGALILGDQTLADPLRELVEHEVDVSAHEAQLVAGDGQLVRQALLNAWREWRSNRA